jgi:hypothetical protein
MANEEKLTINIPLEMHNALYEVAEKTGNPIAAIVRVAIAKELMEWEAREAGRYARWYWQGGSNPMSGMPIPCGGLDGRGMG